MKTKISLKLLVIIMFLALALVLVIGYSMLSARYYMWGMDSIVASNMEQVASSYLESYPQNKRDRLSNFSGYQIAGQWSQMPEEIQRVFGEPPEKPGVMVKQEDSRWPAPPDIIYFLFRYQGSDGPLFVSSRFSRETASALVGRNSRQSMQMLLTISLAIVAGLAMTILFMLRRISRPVTALGQWARALDSENVSRTPPDFSYPELNELAGLICTSLSSVQESLEREHRFLRHASHELRTPIAIIRNNVELLNKLEHRREPERITQRQQVIDRIERAGLTMQHLTETLLWLGKSEVEPFSGKQLELDRLVSELVDEMQYLLTKKEVQLELRTEPCTVFIPEIPARIVLVNLIRNAFQHTWEGTITIHQHGNRVVITNPLPPAVAEQHDLGFGLGLQLTAQLTEKLGWAYVSESLPQTYRATIVLDVPLYMNLNS